MYFKLDKSKKMKRVYLAKSNRANPNLVSAVRQTLSKFNVQIVEFTGGYYTHDLLETCDELYVIPDLNDSFDDEYGGFWSVPIGKGLYEQIEHFSGYNGSTEVFIVTSFGENVGGIYYEGNDDDFHSISVENENDYVKYAYLTINTNNAEIAPWELYDFVLESNDIKDESWVTNVLNESIVEYKTWKEKEGNKKFLFLVAKKLAKLKLS
jgi:hypothetical protein